MTLEELDKIKNEKFVYLTTKGRKSGKDHVVELWFALVNGKVYLSHEGEHTDWIKNLLKDTNVKLKIGGVSLTGEAKIAPAESAERQEGMRALYGKYYGPATKETLDDWFELSAVIEITPK
jgi:deazaflavin-dependent oxidoreductase (nitroreductase family)